MGLFSSKYVTQVGTVVARVVQDNVVPDFAKTAVLRAIFEDQNVSEHLMEEALFSLPVRADQYYRYGESKYTFGLPSGEIYSNTQGREEVQVVLDGLVGSPVLLEYVRYGPPNNLHIGWTQLFADHGYDHTTNILTDLSTSLGKTVYLKDMQVVIPASKVDTIRPESIEQWGLPATVGYTPNRPANSGALGNLVVESPPIVDSSAAEEYILVTYTWMVPGTAGGYNDEPTPPTYPTGTFTIPITGFDDEKDYFHARYVHAGQPYYWMYEVGSGTYPVLDGLLGAPAEVLGSYFPFLYFRFGKQPMNLDTSSDAYKTSKKMAEYLGLDYDQVIEGIHQNPDIDEVEQAMAIFGVPANSQDPGEQQYLYEYFDRMYYALDVQHTFQREASIFRTLFRYSIPVRSSFVIADAAFKLSLNTGGMYKQRLVGTIGAIGSTACGTGILLQPYEMFNQNTDMMETRNFKVPYHFYRKQIGPTLYDEIQVLDLKLQYHIYGNYMETADGDEPTLLIPLDRTITKGYSLGVKEKLYARSIHFVFNSRVVTKLKWYQQEWFSDLLMIVAVVITIITLGKGAPLIAAAAAVGGIIAVAQVILTMIIKYLIVMVIVKLFVKLVGIEAAFIVAIIATAMGMYQSLDTSSVAGAPWGKELLQLSTGLTNAIESELASQMEDLLAEADQFNIFVQEQTKSLETAQELLENQNFLSPFVIFGESPDDFFDRTVHSGNIGIVGINAISSFVETSLLLPKLQDSLGETING